MTDDVNRWLDATRAMHPLPRLALLETLAAGHPDDDNVRRAVDAARDAALPLLPTDAQEEGATMDVVRASTAVLHVVARLVAHLRPPLEYPTTALLAEASHYVRWPEHDPNIRANALALVFREEQVAAVDALRRDL